ncbi:hypothetical protein NQ314_009821, partial [Rhamnusium bicolor]
MCLSNLQYYSKFIKTCLDVEEKIKGYHRINTKSNEKVDLHKVFQFKIKMKKFKQNNRIVENYKTGCDMDFEINSGNDNTEEASSELKSDQINVKSSEKASRQSKGDKNNLENGNVSVNLRKRISKTDASLHEHLIHSYAVLILDYFLYNSMSQNGIELNVTRSPKPVFQVENDSESEYEPTETSSDSEISDDYHRKRKRTKLSEKCTYSCTKCSFATDHKLMYEAHLLRRHHDPPIFMCDLCGYRTDGKLNLNSHLSEHRGATKSFGCKECKYETNSKRCYLWHLVLHTDPKDLTIYKCKFCSFESKHKSIIVSHTKVKHDENLTIYKCEFCSLESKH